MFSIGPIVKSPLGKYRILSEKASIRVSPLCLGCMNFGEANEGMLGKCDIDTTFSILDYYYDNQGNFLDTANAYQAGQSEEWVGEWMEKRGVRDQMVVATKFTSDYQGHNKPTVPANNVGNSSKSMVLSLEASLKKLKTSYVDILYVHWWDFSTSIEELMQSLNHLVASGKVLYLGVSDTPAYIVSKANQYARDYGLRPFSIYQGRWSAIDRDFEREILRMCESEGLAIAPWGVLGGGMFKPAAERQKASGGGRKFYRGLTAGQEKVVDTLEKIAVKKGTLMTSVALAYVRSQSPWRVFPIVGGRSVKNLKENVEALELRLTKEESKEIETAEGFEFGFPYNFLFMGTDNVTHRSTTSDIFLVKMANTTVDVQPHSADVLEGGI